MRQTVIFFTIVAGTVGMIRTSDAVAPHLETPRAHLVVSAPQRAQQRMVWSIDTTANVSNQRQLQFAQGAPFDRSMEAAWHSAGDDASPSPRFDLILMLMVLGGFVVVQLRRAQDYLQRTYVGD